MSAQDRNFHSSVFQTFISILWVLRKEKRETSLGLQEADHNSWLMCVVSLEEFGLRSAFTQLTYSLHFLVIAGDHWYFTQRLDIC